MRKTKPSDFYILDALSETDPQGYLVDIEFSTSRSQAAKAIGRFCEKIERRLKRLKPSSADKAKALAISLLPVKPLEPYFLEYSAEELVKKYSHRSKKSRKCVSCQKTIKKGGRYMNTYGDARHMKCWLEDFKNREDRRIVKHDYFMSLYREEMEAYEERLKLATSRLNALKVECHGSFKKTKRKVVLVPLNLPCRGREWLGAMVSGVHLTSVCDLKKDDVFVDPERDDGDGDCFDSSSWLVVVNDAQDSTEEDVKFCLYLASGLSRCDLPEISQCVASGEVGVDPSLMRVIGHPYQDRIT